MITHVLDYLYYLKDTFEDDISFSFEWLETAQLSYNKETSISDKDSEYYHLVEKIKSCHLCNLSENNINSVIGEGDLNAKIFVVVGTPSETDIKAGKPLAGDAGILFDKMLQAIELSRKDVYITNVLKCFPDYSDSQLTKKIAVCSFFVYEQIKIINPKIIVCMGDDAVRAILQRNGGVEDLRGKVRFPKHKNYKILVTYSPRFLLDNPSFKRKAWEDLKLLRKTIKIYE